jgi:hypothetical protein
LAPLTQRFGVFKGARALDQQRQVVQWIQDILFSFKTPLVNSNDVVQG